VIPTDVERIAAGWAAVVSSDSVSVIFPNRHWERMRERPGLADGRSAVEADIDGLCECIKRGLLAKVAARE